MSAPAGGHALRGTAFLAAIVTAACSAAPATPEAAPMPTSALPAGWVIVSTAGAELQLTLPPWLLVFDNRGPIFANEAPPPGTSDIPIQLMAVPPGVDPDPGPGDDLLAWLDTRVDPGKGVPVVSQVDLPAGPAVRYERLDRAGTPTAWRILAFAIRTPSGMAFLLIDGLPDAWPAHAQDIDRIPLLLRVR